MTRTELMRLMRRLALPVGALALVLAVLTIVTSELTARLAATGARIDELQRDTAATVRDIRRTRAGLAFVRDHRGTYDRAREAGFRAPQDRLAAGNILEQLAVETDLNRMEYTFDAARRAPLGNAGEGAPALVATPLSIEARAAFDRDIFAFVDELRDELPGYLVLRRGRMQRRMQRDFATVEDNPAGQGRPDVIGASLSLAWVRLAFPEEAGDG